MSRQLEKRGERRVGTLLLVDSIPTFCFLALTTVTDFSITFSIILRFVLGRRVMLPNFFTPTNEY